MTQREVVVTALARTAIGSFGGALKDVPLARLATVLVKATLERSRVAPEEVGHVVMGNVIPTEPRDAYLSRIAAMDAGIPQETPAFNVNRPSGRRHRCHPRRQGDQRTASHWRTPRAGHHVHRRRPGIAAIFERC